MQLYDDIGLRLASIIGLLQICLESMLADQL